MQDRYRYSIGLGLFLLFILALRPKELFDGSPPPPPSTVQPQVTPLPTWAIVLIVLFFAICLLVPLVLLFVSPRTFFTFMFLNWLFYKI